MIIGSFLAPLPPRELKSNSTSGLHWSVKSAAKKEYLSDCLLSIPKDLRNRNLTDCTVHLTFYMQRRVQKITGKMIPDNLFRPRDRDNALSSIKKLLDSLEVAKVVQNDKYISYGKIRLLHTRKECEGKIGVLVEIEAPDF